VAVDRATPSGSTPALRWGVLGPLLVRDGSGNDVRVPAGRLRTLLALLLMRANRLVPVDEIADVLWDGRPPDDAVGTVRVYMTRLRRVLGPDAAARLLTRRPGYVCQAGEDEFDLARFEELCRRAGAAAREQRWMRAAGLLTEALGLWRGIPLADVAPGLLRDRESPRLTRLRLQAVEDSIDARLHLRQYGQLIPQLRDLVETEPLREHLHAQLMRALAHTGRRAEALQVYRRAHRTLVEHLGIEPGPELRDLHHRILTGDELTGDELTGDEEPVAAGRQSAPRPARSFVVPRQVPAGVRHFVGRTAELTLLSDLLNEQAAAGTVVISQIGGTAGIGKTTLAVHWAHLNADRFSDGQLYIDLRGFDPTGTPVAPGAAVRQFLAALDVPASRIPADEDAQIGLYRSRLADRRMLVLLDNARDAEQVRPLLPGTPGCLVLVTSRTQMPSLVARDGAVPLMLDLLTTPEARDLLTRRLGAERLARHEHVVDELIALCARLPLALNIAAAQAALRPTHPLPSLVDELRGERPRLDALSTADGTADLRAVFSWSYRTLGPAAARMFRLLALHPLPDTSLPVAASLAALPAADTRHALDELTAACLVQEPTPGRYTLHDLLRVYGAERARDEDDDTQRRDAARRMCDFYSHTAHDAAQLMAPHRSLVRPAAPAPGTVPAQLPDATAALAWFDTEHANLLAAQRAAAGYGWHATVWQLAWDLGVFYSRRGYRHEGLAVWQAALEAAGQLPMPNRIRAYQAIGMSYAELGRHPEAIAALDRALALAEQHDELTNQADAHRQLAFAWGRQGNHRQGLHHATRALALYRTVKLPIWEAAALNNVGWFSALLGEYDAARTACQDALQIYQEHHEPEGKAETLDTLGHIEHHTGNHHQAIAHYQNALTLYRGIGHTVGIVNTLDHIGHPHLALGQHQQARDAWRQALDMYRQQGRDQDAERVRRRLDTLG
jgi:DNA-binding SARP family transcriptional activator/tetratricopeptide (TPR) repeat protein